MDPFSNNLRERLALTAAEAGKLRRLGRLFSPLSGRTVIVPVDDSLIFGPTAGLEQVDSSIRSILQEPPDAILAYPGVFRSCAGVLSKVAAIVNLTASTVRGQHTRKIQVGTLRQAIRLGADAVAIHVNVSSKYEFEMLKTLGSVSQECDSLGVPLLAIMYPRCEGEHGGPDNNYEQR